MATKIDYDWFKQRIQDVKFLSPNEPLTIQGIHRVLQEMQDLTKDVKDRIGVDSIGKAITMWDSTVSYSKGDVVLYFKQDNDDTVEQGKREFVFLLMSTYEKPNNAMPGYDMVDGIPDFSKTNWVLLNPMSYLLQDLNGLRAVVVEVFRSLMDEHVARDHGLIGVNEIESNLLRKDYSNLQTPWRIESRKHTLVNEVRKTAYGEIRKSTNGIMEMSIKYGFDVQANQQVKIDDRRYFRMKSPVWDESDQTIFSQKYIENQTLFPVLLNSDLMRDVWEVEDGEEPPVQQFNNLRYGTNIFFKKIVFDEEFANDEYMVFFDTYEPGQFVFGYDNTDLESKVEPTYDAVVSMPMLMNKSSSGFTVILPIHTYFNSLKKYNVGVPCKNQFRLQVIGRYR